MHEWMRGRLSGGSEGSSLSLPLSALVISRSWGSRTCICFTTMVLSNTCNGGRACASETHPQHCIKNKRQTWNMLLVGLKSSVEQTLWAGNDTHQHWAKLDQGLKCAEHHYHHHISCWPWHSDEQYWTDMDGWLYFRGHREILIWDDLTIQQHDPRCVSGSQQRLTPGVGAHDLIGECAAERLGLPWLHVQTHSPVRSTHTFLCQFPSFSPKYKYVKIKEVWGRLNRNESTWFKRKYFIDKYDLWLKNLGFCGLGGAWNGGRSCSYFFSAQACGNKACRGISSHNGLQLQSLTKKWHQTYHRQQRNLSAIKVTTQQYTKTPEPGLQNVVMLLNMNSSTNYSIKISAKENETLKWESNEMFSFKWCLWLTMVSMLHQPLRTVSSCQSTFNKRCFHGKAASVWADCQFPIQAAQLDLSIYTHKQAMWRQSNQHQATLHSSLPSKEGSIKAYSDLSGINSNMKSLSLRCITQWARVSSEDDKELIPAEQDNQCLHASTFFCFHALQPDVLMPRLCVLEQRATKTSQTEQKTHSNTKEERQGLTGDNGNGNLRGRIPSMTSTRICRAN